MIYIFIIIILSLAVIILQHRKITKEVKKIKDALTMQSIVIDEQRDILKQIYNHNYELVKKLRNKRKSH